MDEKKLFCKYYKNRANLLEKQRANCSEKNHDSRKSDENKIIFNMNISKQIIILIYINLHEISIMTQVESPKKFMVSNEFIFFLNSDYRNFFFYYWNRLLSLQRMIAKSNIDTPKHFIVEM